MAVAPLAGAESQGDHGRRPPVQGDYDRLAGFADRRGYQSFHVRFSGIRLAACGSLATKRASSFG
jgi:hypothetical protein